MYDKRLCVQAKHRMLSKTLYTPIRIVETDIQGLTQVHFRENDIELSYSNISYFLSFFFQKSKVNRKISFLHIPDIPYIYCKHTNLIIILLSVTGELQQLFLCYLLYLT